ncbi:MAG TPA: Crp/Fnr family transcriptional regulator [Candidatus Saccharimonadales bacterium]|nr:Crp/Fnr family transcriptional regulator [Candidatus Saccharimonadales bacterium]
MRPSAVFDRNTPLAQLVAGARVKAYTKNQILFYSGDTTPEIYVLSKGIVKTYDIDHQGNEKVLHLLRSPCIMPLTALYEPEHTTEWFYGTVTDCEVFVLAREALEQRLATDNDLALYVMKQLSCQMHELFAHVSSLNKTDARGRLAHVLKFLAQHYAEDRRGEWRRVTFPVGQQFLADMIGMTRESTTISTKYLRKAHIVRYPRNMVLEINIKNLLAYEPVLT